MVVRVWKGVWNYYSALWVAQYTSATGEAQFTRSPIVVYSSDKNAIVLNLNDFAYSDIHGMATEAARIQKRITGAYLNPELVTERSVLFGHKSNLSAPRPKVKPKIRLRRPSNTTQ